MADKIPDLLIERYLADDLSAEQRARVDAALQDNDVAARFKALKRERDEFYATRSSPAEAFAILRRVAPPRPSSPQKKFWTWFAPVLATACGVLIVFKLYSPALPLSRDVPAASVAPSVLAPKEEPRSFAKPPPSAHTSTGARRAPSNGAPAKPNPEATETFAAPIPAPARAKKEAASDDKMDLRDVEKVEDRPAEREPAGAASIGRAQNAAAPAPSAAAGAVAPSAQPPPPPQAAASNATFNAPSEPHARRKITFSTGGKKFAVVLRRGTSGWEIVFDASHRPVETGDVVLIAGEQSFRLWVSDVAFDSAQLQADANRHLSRTPDASLDIFADP